MVAQGASGGMVEGSVPSDGGGVEGFSDGIVAASTGCGGRLESSSAAMMVEGSCGDGCAEM